MKMAQIDFSTIRNKQEYVREYKTASQSFCSNVASMMSEMYKNKNKYAIDITDAMVYTNQFVDATNITRKNPSMLAASLILISWLEYNQTELSYELFDEFYNDNRDIIGLNSKKPVKKRMDEATRQKYKYALYRYYRYASKFV